jgi:hypothetical protein
MELEDAKLTIAKRISNAINGRFEIPILETVLSHEIGTELYHSAIESLQSEGSIKKESRHSKDLHRSEWVLTEFGKKKYIKK